jgi:hypothetical protein
VPIPVFSLLEAANQLGLTEDAARVMARANFLPHSKDSRGNFLFSETDLRKGRRLLKAAGRGDSPGAPGSPGGNLPGADG